MARTSTRNAEDTVAPENTEEVVVTDETSTEAVATDTAPESTEPAEVIDLDPFIAAATAAIASEDYSAVTAVYNELSRKGKGAATRHANQAVKDALVGKDVPTAMGWSQVTAACASVKAAKEPKAPREPKAPVDTSAATVDRMAALYIGYTTLRDSQAPEVTEDIKSRVAALVGEVGDQVTSYLAWKNDTAEDKGDSPEVSDVVSRAMKLAFTGAGTRRSAGVSASGPRYEGARRSIPEHIAEAFANQPSGTFLTVAEIRNFESSQYGTDHPSAGAISSALGGKSLPEGITPAKGGPKDQAGAVKA